MQQNNVIFEWTTYSAYVKYKGTNFYAFDLRFGKMDKNSQRGYWFSEDLIVKYGDNFDLICELLLSQDYSNYLITKEIINNDAR